MDLIKIPMATILFIGAAYMLIARPDMLSGPVGTVGAVVCIGALVLAIALYTNINITIK
jgi:hypothetical protein